MGLERAVLVAASQEAPVDHLVPEAVRQVAQLELPVVELVAAQAEAVVQLAAEAVASAACLVLLLLP